MEASFIGFIIIPCIILILFSWFLYIIYRRDVQILQLKCEKDLAKNDANHLQECINNSDAKYEKGRADFYQTLMLKFHKELDESNEKKQRASNMIARLMTENEKMKVELDKVSSEQIRNRNRMLHD
jgi:flagellar biosynthesis/type III secretory pathway protein FliH